jgi:ParB family chromosome partitioning protein
LTKQLSVYEKVLKKSLSVRDTEKLVSQIKGISSKSVKSVPEFYIKIKEHIQRRYETNIKFKLSKKTKSVSFDFQNEEKLKVFLKRLNEK